MIQSKFPLGQLVQTRGVAERRFTNNKFDEHVRKSLSRYMQGDWGELCLDDKAQNDEALESGDRILASYIHPAYPDFKIWIITEYDRSVTTILFPHEY